ncbi:DNA-RNApol-7kD domain containing protein [Pyrenophora tritici-repentis]|uniref:Uncharacterized protein n=3 Tax=Pyrenophora tritici-repentis TaxID=45151 RepID=A0A2W1FFR1_9PLEO|nr:uncharacterized protein PTRG_01098 [Pyrenophora tritici-repentis Pt-1C-BFP]KAA8625732.1 DNA-RNApol-7kD multi-domain protein [Pyrenophora tritici-repentis]EDU40536.1 predicted protein [Pyrenophora tritici-repentis Pt-1C-BFP]KAF7454151.1 DNA-RNApol-7kD multi-domain protein [Pyrenophora tritici-repentis]KAG9387899.1 DNA-RNApol-7kD multi-domain protein [Pyrenophora tritici-repentis]KAI0579579.1 DNA-RNApol-7kD multi-domain protein [Pyrenophora tritici-repentis]
MASTTRRQSRLLELGELPASPGKSGEGKMDKKSSSAGEVDQKEEKGINGKTRMIMSTTTDHASPTTNFSNIPKEEESEQKVPRDASETTATTLKERTQSMEMTGIIHALDPLRIPEEEGRVKTEESALYRSSSIVSDADAQAANDNAFSASNSDSDSSDGLEAVFTAELEIDEDPTTGPKPTSTPPSPAPCPSPVVITPPAPPLVASKPSFQTGMVYLAAEYKPWEIVYQCVACEADVRIRGGGQLPYNLSGGNTEMLRCRECGCRILLKKTRRAMQFEAR